MDENVGYWLGASKAVRQQKLRDLVIGQDKTDYIKLVSAGNLGVYASMGLNFNYAIFGRDSIQVASDLLNTHKDLAAKIITTLASLQGVKFDAKSEEEPGRIHHEFRSKIFNGQVVPDTYQGILKTLQRAWGDEASDILRYYGSIDATPQYINLIAAYVKRYGKDILDQTYPSLDGDRLITDSLKLAINWLVGKIETSSWHLLEYKRTNTESGIANQAWKDSGTSYLHPDGQIANADGGIASVEVQGYAYDALVSAANIFPSSDKQNDWLDLAKKLAQQTAKLLWMEDQAFFAQGLDRGPDGQARQISTLTSNGAAILDSGLLNDLPESERKLYIDGIAKAINSDEFLTPAGLRCRALKYAQIPGFVDYHGSYTVWPKETYAVSRGLKRYGQMQLAEKLEASLLESIIKAGEFYEFFYVNGDGGVWYDKDEAIDYFRSLGTSDYIAVPEIGQAWTISAVQAITSNV